VNRHPPAAEAARPSPILEKASAFASLFFLVMGTCLRLMAVGAATSLGANLLVEMFIVIAAVFWAMHVLLTGRMVRLRYPLNVVIAVFFVLAAVSAFRARHLYNSLPALMDLISYLLLFFLVIELGITRRTAGLLVCVLVACAAVLSLYAVFQYHYSLQLILEKLQKDPETILRQLNQPLTAYEDLLARVKDKRVFATFANPNSFAGFLLMTIPLSVGMLIDTCRARWQASVLEAGALFLSIMLQVHAFVLTFSKGGALTLVLVGGLFAVMALWSRIRAHKALAAAVGLAGILVLAGAAAGLAQYAKRADESSPIANKLRGGAESMRVRLNYWKAGVKMIEDNPVLGVGLDNFADHYFRYKVPAGREVQRAHNNYLQVAAEMGIPGLVIFLLLWGWLIGAASRGRNLPLPPPGSAAPYRLVIAAGVLSMLVAVFVLGAMETFEQPVYASIAFVVLACFWAGVFAFAASGSARTHGKPRPIPFTRIGITAGLAGFLLHGLVDYDLYVPGCAQTAWLLAALGIVLCESAPHERVVGVKPPVRWALLIAPVLLGAALMAPGIGLVPRVFTSEFLAGRARNWAMAKPPILDDFSRAADRSRQDAQADPNDPEARYRFEQCNIALRKINNRETGGTLGKMVRLLLEATDFSAAIRANPLNDGLRYERARSYETIWMVRDNDDAAFHLAVRDYLGALKLNPTNGAPYYRLAMMYREAATYNKRLLLEPSPNSAESLSTVEEAERHLESRKLVEGLDVRSAAFDPPYLPYVWAAAEAVQTYPTNALYRACLGEALYSAGLENLGALQYRKALEYDRLADIERLRLPDETRELAARRAAGIER